VLLTLAITLGFAVLIVRALIAVVIALAFGFERIEKRFRRGAPTA
jgi:hypothetical protein